MELETKKDFSETLRLSSAFCDYKSSAIIRISTIVPLSYKIILKVEGNKKNLGNNFHLNYRMNY